jgi:hypothetical protein
LNFQYLHSETAYPAPLRQREGLADEDLGGDAYDLSYQHFTRNWNWTVSNRRLDREFRADSGFIPRVDLFELAGEIQRVWWHDDAFLTSTSVGVNVSRSEDLDDQLSDAKIGVTTFLRGPKQSELFAQAFHIDRRNGDTLFEDLQGAEVFFKLQPSGAVQVSFYVSYEDQVDFFNNRLADQLQLNPNLQLRMGRRTSIALDHFHRALSNAQGTYLQADLSQLRLFYHLSVRSYLRAIVQRTEIDSDADQFVFPQEEHSEDLFTQLLYSYQLNAQTVLYAGYSDARIGGDLFELTQADRTLFVKVGYAFLF